MIYLTIALCVVIFYGCYTQWNYRKLLQDQEKERQKLLDRIQAPTFNHYMAKDLREKKIEAEKGKKEDEERPPQFVS